MKTNIHYPLPPSQPMFPPLVTVGWGGASSSVSRGPWAQPEKGEQTERMKIAPLEPVLPHGTCLCVGFHKKRHMASLSQ